jgi:hypothetical protein
LGIFVSHFVVSPWLESNLSFSIRRLTTGIDIMLAVRTSEKRAQKEKPKQSLQFVAVYPDARARFHGPSNIVRKNAAIHQWKESKDIKPRGRKSKIPPKVVNLGAADTESTTEADTSDGTLTFESTPESSHSPGGEAIDVANEALSLTLATIRYNPYPTTLPTKFVAPLFQFMEYLGPQIAGPSADGRAVNDFTQHFLRHSGVFHAGLLSAANLQSDLNLPYLTSNAASLILNECRAIAIKSAQTLLTSVTSNIKKPDGNEIVHLLSIMCSLSTQADGSSELEYSQPMGPRQAPFKKLDGLAFLGSGKRFQNVHFSAEVRLVEMAGIHEIPTFLAMPNSTYVCSCISTGRAPLTFTVYLSY